MSDDDTPLTVHGNFSVAEWARYRLTKRPESPEDALAVLQGFWDAGEANSGDGLTFSVPKGKTEAMDANPMLERTDAPDEEET